MGSTELPHRRTEQLRVMTASESQQPACEVSRLDPERVTDVLEGKHRLLAVDVDATDPALRLGRTGCVPALEVNHGIQENREHQSLLRSIRRSRRETIEVLVWQKRIWNRDVMERLGVAG